MVHVLQLQALAAKMLHNWTINVQVRIVIDEDHTILPDDWHGLYDYITETVIVERCHDDLGTLYQFYHEMRHLWQHHKWPLTFLWWTSLGNTLYHELYDVCPLEKDAETFGTRSLQDPAHCSNVQGREDLLLECQRLLVVTKRHDILAFYRSRLS